MSERRRHARVPSVVDSRNRGSESNCQRDGSSVAESGTAATTDAATARTALARLLIAPDRTLITCAQQATTDLDRARRFHDRVGIAPLRRAIDRADDPDARRGRRALARFERYHRTVSSDSDGNATTGSLSDETVVRSRRADDVQFHRGRDTALGVGAERRDDDAASSHG